MDENTIFSISPLLIIPDAASDFAVYLKQGEHLVLYTKRGESFSRGHRQRLFERGVRRVYVSSSEKGDYDRYIHKHLGKLLADEDIPIEERSEAWFEVSVDLVKEVFDSRLPQKRSSRQFEKVRELIRASITFLGNEKALKHVAKLLDSGFTVFNHSICVMTLCICVLQTYPDMNEMLLMRSGIGAMLHDVGKSRIPEHLVGSIYPELSGADLEAYKNHPALGVALSADLELPQESTDCILFHHELLNGRGFPAGLHGDEIPRHVRVLSVVNTYDNLTRNRPDMNGKTPFEALSYLKSRAEAYDQDVLRRLITVLSSADIASFS